MKSATHAGLLIIPLLVEDDEDDDESEAVDKIKGVGVLGGPVL